MLDKYKESYEYLKTEAEDVSRTVKSSKLSLGQRIAAVPGFFREGLRHMRNVNAVFPLMCIKLFLIVFVTGMTFLATFWIAEVFNGYAQVNESATEQAQSAVPWMLVAMMMVIWIPYVGLVTMIEGLFNGAMGAATYMHAEGHPPTVDGALKIARQNAPTIWKFNAIQFFVRLLTSSGKNSGLATTFAKAALRTAWTYGTVGMMPAILNGKSLVDAMKRSIEFLKTKPVKIISLIFAKGLCSLVLVLGSAGLIAVGTYYDIYGLYIVAGFLIILITFIYPIYVSVLYMLYVEFLKEKQYSLEVRPDADPSSLVTWVLAIYVICTGGVFLLGMLA